MVGFFGMRLWSTGVDAGDLVKEVACFCGPLLACFCGPLLACFCGPLQLHTCRKDIKVILCISVCVCQCVWPASGIQMWPASAIQMWPDSAIQSCGPLQPYKAVARYSHILVQHSSPHIHTLHHTQHTHTPTHSEPPLENIKTNLFLNLAHTYRTFETISSLLWTGNDGLRLFLCAKAWSSCVTGVHCTVRQV